MVKKKHALAKEIKLSKSKYFLLHIHLFLFIVVINFKNPPPTTIREFNPEFIIRSP